MRDMMSKPMPESYWASRSEMLYYHCVETFLAAFAHDAENIIDIGSGQAGYLERIDWIPERYTLDRAPPYESQAVKGIHCNFFEFKPDRKYEVALCLQVLEHIDDAKSFAAHLFEVADRVIISVPYQWPEGASPHHVQDPVDEAKLREWTGREPSHLVIVSEPLERPEVSRRLVAYYHPSGQRFSLAEARLSMHPSPLRAVSGAVMRSRRSLQRRLATRLAAMIQRGGEKVMFRRTRS